MLPKSATNPIAIEISGIIGGIPSLTVSLVVIAGVFGGVFGPEILKLMRVKNDVARGIALGSMSHAVGTARAFKEGEVEGSMSSLAMAIAGTLTAILSPIFTLFL
jgi:putative effector of murein hydrolase